MGGTMLLAQNPVFNGITSASTTRSVRRIRSVLEARRPQARWIRARETEKKTEWRRTGKKSAERYTWWRKRTCGARLPRPRRSSRLGSERRRLRSSAPFTAGVELYVTGSICAASYRRCGGGGGKQDAAQRRLPWEATSDVSSACRSLDFSRCPSLVLFLFLSSFLFLSLSLTLQKGTYGRYGLKCGNTMCHDTVLNNFPSC